MGPVADQLIVRPDLMKSAGVFSGESLWTSQTHGEALTVPRWPKLARS